MHMADCCCRQHLAKSKAALELRKAEAVAKVVQSAQHQLQPVGERLEQEAAVRKEQDKKEEVTGGSCAVICMLCCAVLCCAVLCCAVLCWAVLRCAVPPYAGACRLLCCAVMCCAVLCCASRGCVALRQSQWWHSHITRVMTRLHGLPCSAMLLCYATLCCAASRFAVLCIQSSQCVRGRTENDSRTHTSPRVSE